MTLFSRLRKIYNNYKNNKLKGTYLLISSVLLSDRATVSLNHWTLVLVVGSVGVSGAAASQVIASNLRPSTINQLSFSLLLCLVYICLRISFWNLLLNNFTHWFSIRHALLLLLLMFFNCISFLLWYTTAGVLALLRLFDHLHTGVLWE